MSTDERVNREPPTDKYLKKRGKPVNLVGPVSSSGTYKRCPECEKLKRGGMLSTQQKSEEDDSTYLICSYWYLCDYKEKLVEVERPSVIETPIEFAHPEDIGGAGGNATDSKLGPLICQT